MRVLVVGSTGVLGRHTIPRLLERGHEVRAVARRAEQVERLLRIGVETYQGDILDPRSLIRPADGVEAVLHLATSIPSWDGTSGGWELNNRIRREGTSNLLQAAEYGGARRYVQQSIAFLYGDSPVLVDEDAPLLAASSFQSAADMEARVRESPLEWVILRGGLLYGPGTGQAAVIEAARNCTPPTYPGDGSDIWSLIHISDYAQAFVLAAESAGPGSIFNVVDDTPVSVGEYETYIANQFGCGDVRAGGEKFFPSVAVNNARIKAELGWLPTYPSYRTGLAE